MKYLTIIVILVIGVLMTSMQPLQPAYAAGDGLIVTGDPTRDGDVVLTIKCQNKDGAIETINATVPILATDDEDEKADKIDAGISLLKPACFTVGGTDNEITLTPNDEDGKIVEIDIVSSTSELIGSKCTRRGDAHAGQGLAQAHRLHGGRDARVRRGGALVAARTRRRLRTGRRAL